MFNNYEALNDCELAEKIQQNEYLSMTNQNRQPRTIVQTYVNRPDSYELLSWLSNLIGNVSRGADEADINQLPVSKYEPKTNGEDDRCTICSTEYNSNTDIITLPCQHFYCKNCTIKWLKINKQCPICRQDITEC